jgi:hypothetical protein
MFDPEITERIELIIGHLELAAGHLDRVTDLIQDDKRWTKTWASRSWDPGLADDLLGWACELRETCVSNTEKKGQVIDLVEGW